MPKPYCMILTTATSQDEADLLARLLVERRLAACVQAIPMRSTYHWQGAVQQEAEILLLVKTAARLYAQVEAAILETHSYEVPEILQVPVERGLESYLGWISESIA